MSPFNSHPTREYLQAVEALRKIPLEERSSAFADATAADMREIADKQLGKPISGRKSWRRLLDEKDGDSDKLPGDDHVELRRAEALTYVSQPYHLNFDELKELMSVCMAHGLEAQIDARSWCYPSGTIRVSYTKRAT